MCSGGDADGTLDLNAALDALAAADPAELADQQLREQLRELVAASHRLHAELVRRVDTFDTRRLAGPDGFRTTKGWLRAFTRLSGPAAHRLVATARMLRRLPKLAAAAQAGDASAEHLHQVSRLVEQVGEAAVADLDPVLAEASAGVDPQQLGTVCARVRAYVDPDGPDPAAVLDRRCLTLSPVAGMMAIRGQLDPEGGAVLATALDVLMTPPGEGDQRTPAQRRADALVELAGRPLASGTLPTVGGQRPQVGILLHPQALSPETLAALADAQGQTRTADRLRRFMAGAVPAGAVPAGAVPAGAVPAGAVPAGAHPAGAVASSGPGPSSGSSPCPTPSFGAERGPGHPASRPPEPIPAGAAHPAWTRPSWTDPPWLDWFGAIPHVVAQRIACDADIYRIVLDPANGQPLDVGRAHRLVPYWIRKALHARDRGCRWPGCTTPTPWVDAHHLQPWADGGETSADRCILLCRHHHSLVHEGGWSIHLHQESGDVTVARPGGLPYRIPARSPSWTGPTTPG